MEHSIRVLACEKMQISVDRESTTPIYRQIEAQIRALILAEQLPRGSRLPAERMLARHLRVNRTTVVNAYRELAADGFVQGHVGRGTIVLGPSTQEREGERSAPLPLSWTGLMRPNVRSLQNPMVRRVADLISRPGIISLATGVPKAEASPHVHLEEAAKQVVAARGQALLTDSPAAGLVPLRVELARRLAMKGCSRLSPNHVLVLSGSQQGLYLVAHLLLRPGDGVLVESPTYLGALEVFRALGARLVELPVDDEGMRVEAAERVLGHADIRLIYTIPNFQNPTGTTMSAQRRGALLALAQRHQVPILEDDLYGELFYEGSPPAPIRAIDENGYVLYCGSLSSVLGPGLRLGWLVAPPAIIQPLMALRQAIDLHPNSFTQEVVCELLVDGSLDRHLAWARQTYARRRDAMLTCLDQYMPEGVEWLRPKGGFYVWCSLPVPVRGAELLEEAAGEGVVFVPGDVFFPTGGGEHFARLSFVHSSEEEIVEGVRRLARGVKNLAGRARRTPQVAGQDRPIV